MIGWIKIHRSLLDWEWYTDTNCKALFIHLLLKVNIEDKKWRGREIKKGSTITGRLQLSAELGLSEQQIRTAINKLKKTGELTTKNHPLGTMFTVVKWNKYQNSNQDNNQASTTEQPSSNQASTTEQPQLNKANKEKNDKKGEEEIKIRALLNLYLNNEKLCSDIIRNHKLKSREILIKRLREFEVSLENRGDTDKTEKDFIKHFASWMDKKAEYTKPPAPNSWESGKQPRY